MTLIRDRRSGSCVVMPVGQRPVLHILYCSQPMAIKAAVPIATASAPMAMTFTKSVDILKPPVMIREMSCTPPLFQIISYPCQCHYCGNRGGILNELINRTGCSPSAVYGDEIRFCLQYDSQVFFDIPCGNLHA